jgi:hypothetical protein
MNVREQGKNGFMRMAAIGKRVFPRAAGAYRKAKRGYMTILDHFSQYKFFSPLGQYLSGVNV